MDDIYRKLAAEIAATKGAGTDMGDAFASTSFDTYLGGKVEGKTAYVHGTQEQLATLREGMVMLLSLLRAQYWVYQHAHWQVAGEGFYGDHLMFQRLYEGVSAEIDTLAEKAIGYLGMDVLQADDVMQRSQIWVNRWQAVGCPYKRALKAEEDFQHYTRNFYDTVERMNVLSMGLDDYIQGICSNHDSHVYLVQQRLAFKDSKEGKRAVELAKQAREEGPSTVKVASLGDLTNFVRVGKNTLIHKSDQDFWRLRKDADGNHVIERLVDEDVLTPGG